MTPGWAASSLTAEDIATHIDEIMDNGESLVLANVHEEFDFMQARLPSPTAVGCAACATLQRTTVTRTDDPHG
jgi:hypothetical protein